MSHGTDPSPETTIAAAVATARRKLGVHRLAQRAAVSPGMVAGVCCGLISFDAAALRRLLSEAERALAPKSR
jgi:hypothetical protein